MNGWGNLGKSLATDSRFMLFSPFPLCKPLRMKCHTNLYKSWKNKSNMD